MLRPYFELSKVIDGVFGLANRLYGITFKENKDIPVYHPDVKAYEGRIRIYQYIIPMLRHTRCLMRTDRSLLYSMPTSIHVRESREVHG